MGTRYWAMSTPPFSPGLRLQRVCPDTTVQPGATTARLPQL
jgi:hypothetical protein